MVEESVVDLKHKTLTTYTRNVGYTTLLVGGGLWCQMKIDECELRVVWW